MGAVADRLLDLAASAGPRLLGGRLEAEPELGSDPRFPPLLRSRRFGWTHYGVMIPDLPEPHRFFTIMSLVGATGTRAFDTDHARVDSPRRTATLVNGTAATAPGFFRAYSIPGECEMTDGGELIRFGEDLAIAGTYPRIAVSGTRGGFSFALELELTGQSTHFMRSPGYVHLSVLCAYLGEIAWNGDPMMPVEGICTFEYAACVSPHMLPGVDRELSFGRKVPLDFFTYQVINVDSETQLLLGVTRALGRPLIEAAYVRSRASEARRVIAGVDFEVLEHQAEPEIAPDGAQMRVPRTMRWRTPAGAAIELDLTCEVDTPMIYGLGSGYVGGFSHEGRLDGREITGRGYAEYIDRESH